ncbi:MAG: CDP-glucose 4,6-dehydratase [Hyphomicrobium sp.]
MNASFWKGRRVLLTGHTGFKGAWASAILCDLGAEVTGLALAPEGEDNLWKLVGQRLRMAHHCTDLRDRAAVEALCRQTRPQIVLHMAAQAQVRRSYEDPVGTFESNVSGPVNLLEALRAIDGIETVLAVTSDKVYYNDDSGRTFDERAPLGGSDPYSASKAACEIAVRSYAESYFKPRKIPIATARGGNVIGGGDFASDRLVPDLFRAAREGCTVELRYPKSRRPWQHVLDCVAGYLAFIEFLQSRADAAPPCLNFGPKPGSDLTVAEIAEEIGRHLASGGAWRQAQGDTPPEKQVLRLDVSLAREVLGWNSKLEIAETIQWTADWYRAFIEGADPLELMRTQIAQYVQRSAAA